VRGAESFVVEEGSATVTTQEEEGIVAPVLPSTLDNWSPAECLSALVMAHLYLYRRYSVISTFIYVQYARTKGA
jgi:hypothetical protein